MGCPNCSSCIVHYLNIICYLRTFRTVGSSFLELLVRMFSYYWRALRETRDEEKANRHIYNLPEQLRQGSLSIPTATAVAVWEISEGQRVDREAAQTPYLPTPYATSASCCNTSKAYHTDCDAADDTAYVSLSVGRLFAPSAPRTGCEGVPYLPSIP